MQRTRWNHRLVTELFRQHGCTLLSTEYVRVKDKLSYECRCGAICENRLGDFLKGVESCIECRKRPREEEKIEEDENPNKRRRVIDMESLIVDYPEQPLPIPPYIFGCWLGDGHESAASLTNIDPEPIAEWLAYAESQNQRVRVSDDGMTYYIVHKSMDNISVGRVPKENVHNCIKDRLNGVSVHACLQKYGLNTRLQEKWIERYQSEGKEGVDRFYDEFAPVGGKTILQKLKELGVFKNKHVPDIYKYNSRKNRQELIAGFLDTDGSLHHKGYRFGQCAKHEKIVDGILEIATSLGSSTTKTAFPVKYIKKNGENAQRIQCYIYNHLSNQYPVRIARKRLIQSAEQSSTTENKDNSV
jgi:replicative DNA helicase